MNENTENNIVGFTPDPIPEDTVQTDAPAPFTPDPSPLTPEQKEELDKSLKQMGALLPEGAHIVGTVGEPPSQEFDSGDPQTIKLGGIYDHCLLGATIRGNYAYSLKAMVKFEMAHRGVTEDEARQVIGKDIVELVRQYGNLAPEFIDDELMETRVEIIMPGGRNR